MGQSNCACINNQEGEVFHRKKLIASQSMNKSTQNDEDLKLLKSIVKIQSALRGWLTRRRYHHLQIKLYDMRVNRQLLKFSKTHLKVYFGETLAINSFPFDKYSHPDQNKAMYEDRYFHDSQMLENASIYIGEWANSKKNGKGIQVWKDGSIYEGFWVDDQAHGRGRLYHANGDIYEGVQKKYLQFQEWAHHKTKGFGIYYHKDGAKYEGQWDDDKQNGLGTETWPDGTKFEGQYQDGEKHGFGRFAWSDGARFSGNFIRNHIHGIGRYVWPDGRSYCGEWANDKMNGKGIFQWEDGRLYIGGYSDDKKSGQGMFEWQKNYLCLRPGGKKYVGFWLNGNQNGKGIYFTGSGQNMTRKQGEWKNGQRERWIIFDNDTIQLEKLEIQLTKIKNYYMSLTDEEIKKNKAIVE